MRTRRVSLFAIVTLLLIPLPGVADASAQATPVAVTCAATPVAAERDGVSSRRSRTMPVAR